MRGSTSATTSTATASSRPTQWTHFFAEQPELQSYFQRVMEKYDIGRHVLWETEVTEASWDDASAHLAVRARDRNGATTTLSARAVISAVGQLNRPHLPDIPGKELFSGPAFHSAEWDHSVDLRGKRVALIGAGASGFQIAPAIAGRVERLIVFQRTAQWMFPNRTTTPRSAPACGGRCVICRSTDAGTGSCCSGRAVTRGWRPPGSTRITPTSSAPSASPTRSSGICSPWIMSQVGDDAELLAKVLPDYPATGKRTLQDNGSWLKTLTRDNVDLVRTGIARIERDGVVTDDGVRHEAEVILYTTGFRPTGCCGR